MPYDAPATGKRIPRDAQVPPRTRGADLRPSSVQHVGECRRSPRLRVALHSRNGTSMGSLTAPISHLRTCGSIPAGFDRSPSTESFRPRLPVGLRRGTAPAKESMRFSKPVAIKRRAGSAMATSVRRSGDSCPIRGLAQDLQGSSPRAIRRGKREDQRRHAGAVGGVAGHAL